MAAIEERQRKYASLFAGGWEAECLSDIGTLGLIDVPWLMTKLRQQRGGKSGNRNANGDPRPNSIGPSESPLEFMHSEESEPMPGIVIVTGYPFAKVIVRFIAKMMRVGVVFLHKNGLSVPLLSSFALPASQNSIVSPAASLPFTPEVPPHQPDR